MVIGEQSRKFYELSPAERRASLGLPPQTVRILENQALDGDLADNLIENQVGEVEIPLGIARNFVINGRPYAVPLATEEPSVIAAASNGAKLAGSFTARADSRLMRGQVVFYEVTDGQALAQAVAGLQTAIFERAQAAYPSIYQRGGGLRTVTTRLVGQDFLSVDCLVDVRDAMGANIVNAILEAMADLFRERFPDQRVLFSILSNYATESLVTASCRIPFARLSRQGAAGEQVARKIALASQYARLDPYRAVTHNKGIMNGVAALVLATGNDTRAIAAGVHAYAAADGQYRGLGDWRVEADELVGGLTLPLPLATVGGGTRVLPKAQAALEILGVERAAELAQVAVCVGLAQNLAALRALVSEGIQRGHMSLQARSLALSVGAQGDEVAELAQALRREPVMNQQVARQLLAHLHQHD